MNAPRLHRPVGTTTRLLAAATALLFFNTAQATTTQFFDSNQVATLIATGITTDTISSEGYRFTYTRDKLFTGGVGLTNPIGRTVRVPWPQGVEAQAVTAGPNPVSARIDLKRMDGGVFDLTALTFKLLANTAGAGGSVEIMPIRNGEDLLSNPIAFDATGYYGQQFSYSTAPNPWGSTAKLTNADTYKITLYVDFALTALTLVDFVPPVNHAPTNILISGSTVLENDPAGTWIGTIDALDPDAGDTFVYSLVAGTGGADNAKFEIVGADLYTLDSFNFEVSNTYSIRVQAEDQGLLATQKVFQIAVLDVDEPPPEFDLSSGLETGAMVIRWSAIPNHLYTLSASTNLLAGFAVVQSNIPPDAVLNCYTDTVSAPLKFWKLTTTP